MVFESQRVINMVTEKVKETLNLYMKLCTHTNTYPPTRSSQIVDAYAVCSVHKVPNTLLNTLASFRPDMKIREYGT